MHANRDYFFFIKMKHPILSTVRCLFSSKKNAFEFYIVGTTMTCSNMMMIWMEWKKQGTMKYSHKQLKYFPLQSLFKRFSNIIAMLWNASKYLFTKIF